MRALITIFICLTICACSPKHYSAATPILEAKRELSKYNMEMNYGKNSFSGLLLFMENDKGEIIIHGSTLFGLTVFNFGLTEERWNIYSCIEPLKGKRVQKLLENDFRRLFLPGGKGKNIDIYPPEDGKGRQVVIRHKLLGIEMMFEEIVN